MKKNKVSCLVPTLNVAHKLKIAIKCFVEQSHDNKEMLILFRDHDVETKKYLLGLTPEWRQKHNIRLFLYTQDETHNLGSLLNFLISKADGEYCMIWDSDDWYNKNRIQKQLEYLISNDKVSCTLSNVLLYSYKYNTIKLSNSRDLEGWEQTLLCKTDYLPLYENIHPTHDTPVLFYLVSNNMNCVLKDSSLYIYTIHSNQNASSNEHLDLLYDISTDIEDDYSSQIKLISNA